MEISPGYQFRRETIMAIGFLIEFPDMSSEQSATILEELGMNGTPPPGQILHVEEPMEGGGTWVVDVWESDEVFQRLIQERLAPIMQRLGVQPPHPAAVWPVTAVLK
jgi:hypothetical protein